MLTALCPVPSPQLDVHPPETRSSHREASNEAFARILSILDRQRTDIRQKMERLDEQLHHLMRLKLRLSQRETQVGPNIPVTHCLLILFSTRHHTISCS